MASFKELHKDLFEGATLTIGRIHKYFVTAENIYIKKNNYKPIHIYRWWIKDKERNIDELEEKTRYILKVLEDFRDQMHQLKNNPSYESYEEIIQKIKTFTEEHSAIINELLAYVEFLNEKDELALIMLYYWDIWGSSKNDAVSRNQDEIPQDDPKFDKYCVEFAIGVKDGNGITIYEDTKWRIYGDYYDSVDPEYTSRTGPPDFSKQIFNTTGWKIMENLSLFFSCTRKGIRRILDKIDEYWNENYPEVVLENQIKRIKKAICSEIDEKVRSKRQFNAVIDNLLSIYGSHLQIPLFKTKEDIDEEDFHNKVYRQLYSNLGSKVENHKKVAKGDIDFLIYNYPVDVKVEDTEQDLDKIYEAHKDQVAYYCYNRKEDVGFLVVYDNTEKTKNYSTKDVSVFEEKGFKIIVILLRGNFPYPSTIKHKKLNINKQ